MTIEEIKQSIDDNTAAVLRLCELIDFAASATKLVSKAGEEQIPVSSSPVNDDAHACSPQGDVAVDAPEATSSSPVAPDVTYEDAKNAVISYANSHGRQAALEILKPFGIPNVKSADPKDYAAIVEACNGR